MEQQEYQRGGEPRLVGEIISELVRNGQVMPWLLKEGNE